MSPTIQFIVGGTGIPIMIAGMLIMLFMNSVSMAVLIAFVMILTLFPKVKQK